MHPFRRLIVPAVILIMIITVGISYYVFAEKWTLIDAFYMMLITLSTVGYGEVKTLSETGRLVTGGIIIVGVGTMAYTISKVIEMIFEGQIVGYRRRSEMEQKIKELKNHFIICGFGRVGHQVAEEFDLKKIPYVIIDSKTETAEELGGKGIPYIIGDITTDEVLESAGVKKAKGLIACADSDTANVYVTLSARVINPKLYIVARAGHVESESKLKRAGADRVISPYLISGKRMAAMVMKPVATEFLDIVVHSDKLDLELEEYNIHDKCKMIGRSLSDLEIKQKTGALIIAIKDAKGKLNIQPGAKTVLNNGDVMVALGAPQALGKLREMVC